MKIYECGKICGHLGHSYLSSALVFSKGRSIKVTSWSPEDSLEQQAETPWTTLRNRPNICPNPSFDPEYNSDFLKDSGVKDSECAVFLLAQPTFLFPSFLPQTAAVSQRSAG